jgi:hypothetical protein
LVGEIFMGIIIGPNVADIAPECVSTVLAQQLERALECVSQNSLTGQVPLWQLTTRPYLWAGTSR